MPVARPCTRPVKNCSCATPWITTKPHPVAVRAVAQHPAAHLPDIATGFAPNSDFMIKRHQTKVSPDHTTYENIDTMEVRRFIGSMPRAPIMNGPPPPMPAALARALAGQSSPVSTKPMFTMIRMAQNPNYNGAAK